MRSTSIRCRVAFVACAGAKRCCALVGALSKRAGSMGAARCPSRLYRCLRTVGIPLKAKRGRGPANPRFVPGLRRGERESHATTLAGAGRSQGHLTDVYPLTHSEAARPAPRSSAWLAGRLSGVAPGVERTCRALPRDRSQSRAPTPSRGRVQEERSPAGNMARISLSLF
jgi:hypothetical protein